MADPNQDNRHESRRPDQPDNQVDLTKEKEITNSTNSSNKRPTQAFVQREGNSARASNAGNNAARDDEDDEEQIFKTQGDRLPDARSFKATYIDTVDLLKASGSNFVRWEREILQEIEGPGVSQVINIKLQRPKKMDPDREKWRYWSMKTCGWLCKCIDEEIMLSIETNCRPFPKYADDLWKEITKVVSRKDKFDNVEAEVHAFLDIKRRGYSSVSAYVAAFRRQINVLANYNVQPTPFTCLVMLLRELEEEVPGVETIRERLWDMIPKDISMDTFTEQCLELVNMSKKSDSASITRPFPARTGRMSSTERDNGDKPAGTFQFISMA